MGPPRAREVQAKLGKFVRLASQRLAALELSGMQVPREHLGLMSCWNSL